MATAAEILATAARHFAEGNLALAEQVSLSVLTGDPSHAEALHLLGLIARAGGNLSAAIDYLQKSVTRNRANPVAWKNLGDARLVHRDFRDAVASYEQALRLRPDLLEAHNHMGIALQHLSEWERAAGCFQQALRLAPAYVPAHNNLGSALRGQGKRAEAAAAFKQALALQPDNPEIIYNLGTVLHEDGELDQAVVYYREALRLRPGYADVASSFATALKEQGFLDEAVAHFRATLTLQPDHGLALYNLSELAAEGRYTLAPEELARMKELVASGDGSPAERSHRAFALATVLHKQGRHDEAFGYFQEANDLRKRLNRERNIIFDAQAHDAMVDRVVATYGRSYFERVKKWGTATELPVFIVGMPRSGSTLVEQILASHPRVFGAGEIGDLHQFVTAVAPAQRANLYTAPLLPNVRVARRVAADYLEFISTRAQKAGRVTVKTLENYLHLGVIATLFPRARVIHCRRDPIDVCLSCYFQNFQSIEFASSLEDIGAYYRAYEKLMAHWSRVLPLEVHEIANEELIHNQGPVTRALLAYCGLDWDERCLAFWSTRRAVQTASTVQVRKPISAQAIGRWRHYRSHLSPLFQALGRSMDAAQK